MERNVIEGVYKDKKFSKFPANFYIDIQFTQNEVENENENQNQNQNQDETEKEKGKEKEKKEDKEDKGEETEKEEETIKQAEVNSDSWFMNFVFNLKKMYLENYFWFLFLKIK